MPLSVLVLYILIIHVSSKSSNKSNNNSRILGESHLIIIVIIIMIIIIIIMIISAGTPLISNSFHFSWNPKCFEFWDKLGENCIQIFHLGRYIVGCTVGNFVLQ